MDRTTSTPPARSDTATTWIFLPSRTTVTSGVRGSRGTGRIRSVVSRASCIGTSVGVRSTSVATRAFGAPPNWALASHGPWAYRVGTNRPPSGTYRAAPSSATRCTGVGVGLLGAAQLVGEGARTWSFTAGTTGGASRHGGTPSSGVAAHTPGPCTSAQCEWLTWWIVKQACRAL